MNEYISNSDFSIDKVIENNRIKFGTWRRLNSIQRGQVLDSIFDGDYTMEILADIAPQLRVETISDDYRSVQSMYMSQNQIQPRSRESIDVLSSTLNKELMQLRLEMKATKTELTRKIEESQ